MASPPRPVNLTVSDFTDTSSELSPVLEKLFSALNPFFNDVYTALYGQLTVLENVLSTVKTVSVTVPATADAYPRAVYTTEANQDFADGISEIVNFADKTYDTHNAVTVGASWKFTVPAGCGGAYRVQAHITIDDFGSPEAAGEPAFLSVYQTPVGGAAAEAARVDRKNGAALDDTVTFGGGSDFLADAGSTIDIRFFQNTGATRTLQAGAICNRIAISRIYDASAVPAAFSGPGWPIALQPSFTSPVKAVILASVKDNASGVITTVAASPAWYASSGKIYVTRIPDLVPSRSYTLNFLLLG